VASLQQELAVEVNQKHQAEMMAVDLTVEVSSRWVEIVRLNAKAGKLHDQVNGKISLASAVLFYIFRQAL
jgi:hypothetical protein